MGRPEGAAACDAPGRGPSQTRGAARIRPQAPRPVSGRAGLTAMAADRRGAEGSRRPTPRDGAASTKSQAPRPVSGRAGLTAMAADRRCCGVRRPGTGLQASNRRLPAPSRGGLVWRRADGAERHRALATSDAPGRGCKLQIAGSPPRLGAGWSGGGLTERRGAEGTRRSTPRGRGCKLQIAGSPPRLGAGWSGGDGCGSEMLRRPTPRDGAASFKSQAPRPVSGRAGPAAG